MKKNTTVKIVMLVVGLMLSLVLAFGSWAVYDKYGIRSPGILAAEALAPSRPQGFAGIGEMLDTQLFVDWLFWVGMICAIYFTVTGLSTRLKGRR
jgi:hypothetical protein